MVAPLRIVSVKIPGLHAPLPCVVPSEKIVSPSLPASRSVTGFVATAPVSPDMVTTEFAAADNDVSVTKVTVMVFVPVASGLF